MIAASGSVSRICPPVGGSCLHSGTARHAEVDAGPWKGLLVRTLSPLSLTRVEVVMAVAVKGRVKEYVSSEMFPSERDRGVEAAAILTGAFYIALE